jgi:hypothetical protein
MRECLGLEAAKALLEDYILIVGGYFAYGAPPL